MRLQSALANHQRLARDSSCWSLAGETLATTPPATRSGRLDDYTTC